MEESKELGDRKEKLISFFKTNKTIVYYLAFLFLLIVGTVIRVLNLKNLKNSPLSIDDPYLFYRYAQYIVEHGKLMALDTMRYVPLGYDTTGERGIIVSYIIAYLYKFFNFFMPSLRLITINNIYPVIFFALTLLVFFLLVKRLFGIKTALISSLLLAILPPFLFRTMAGFSDKEPLGLFLMFLTFYLYVLGWQSKTQLKNIIYGSLAGLASFIMAISWGGYQFVIIPISVFVFIEFLLDKIKKPDALVYASWLALFLIPYTIYLKMIYGSALFSIIKGLLVSFSTVIPIFVLLTLFIRYLLGKSPNTLSKFKELLPYGILSLITSFIISIITAIILFGFSTIPHRLNELKEQIISPIGTSRFVQTVAEAHQTFFISDWTSSFGPSFLSSFFSSKISQCNPLHTGIPLYFALFFIGSILLFYLTLKKLPKLYSLSLTLLYTLLISALIFTKTISNSSCTFNGTSPTSINIYIGSIFLFFIVSLIIYLYTFYKRKDVYKEILNIDKRCAFILILFMLTIIATRGAQRLFTVFSPVTAILAGYLIIYASKTILKEFYTKKIELSILLLTFASLIIGIFFYKTLFLWMAVILILTFGLFEILKTEKYNIFKNYKFLKIAFWIILMFFIAFVVFNFSHTSYVTAQYSGTGFDAQWQQAMSWVKSNTPKETTVFAHWWDYGYVVQSAGERATILDGGNAIYYWDYLMGRHVLTGQTEKEALEFLYAHNASHL